MFSRRAALAALLAPALSAQDPMPKLFSDAEAYERFMGRWSSLLAVPLVDFASIPDSGRLLDVGSGTGSLAFAACKLKPRCQVVGIDPSEEYVGYAKSRNPFPERATFQVGDAQKLDFEDGTFENSLSLLVFNFIPDRQKALREVMRVTKPGGCFSAAVWDYGSGMRMLRAFWDAAVKVDATAEKSDERHMPLCRAGELSEFCKAGGLRQVTERPLDITMRFTSFADFWDPFLLGQGPAGALVKHLDNSRRRTLREELKRQLAPASETAPFQLTARAWAVRGLVPGRP